MKKLFRIGLLLLISLTCLYNNGFSQLGELGNMLAGGAADAEVLLKPYIAPAVNAFGTALGGGWYNTAETHKPGGFDLTFTVTAAIIPKDNKTFIIDTAQLSVLQLNDPSNTLSQSIAGGKTSGPQIDYGYDEFTQPAFNMPQGLNIRWVPSPMIQAGVGLIKGTDLMFRYMPNIKVKGNEFGLWGIGGKHNIKQWIPGLKDIPVLQISVMYGYTRLHTYVNLDVNKASINAGALPGEDANEWNDQYLKLVTKSQTVNLLIGANLPVVSFYGGFGLIITKTSLKLEGEYPMVGLDGVIPTVYAISDPISMTIKNDNGHSTKPRVNVGMRLKLAVITLHFDYSWANYSALTGGLGISIR
jgi:hypothetical protein